MSNEARAQVSFVMTLLDNGKLMLSESGMHKDEASGSKTSYTTWHEVEGTCYPEEMAYVMWAQMEQHL